MNALRAICVVIAIGTTGCASWKTSTKPIDLEDSSVALDAKQRVVVSKHVKKTITALEPTVVSKGSDATGGVTIDTQVTEMSRSPAVAPASSNAASTDLTPVTRVVFDGPYTCAEPSPDALSVLGASADLGLSKPGGLAGSGSLSLSEAAASIGLRTQSIQLLRDQNFRICEAGSNNQITDVEAQTLLRRNQSTMLGVLAIEQLTGPVVAAQAALTSAAQAGLGAPTAEELAKAREGVTAAEDALVEGQKTLADSRTAADEKHAASAKARRALEAVAEGSDTGSLESDLAEAEAAAARADNAADDARNKVALLERRVAAREQELALLTVGHSSSGAVSAAQLAQMSAQSSEAAKNLSAAVSFIVSETNASYVRDGCFGLVSDLITNPRKIELLNQAQKKEGVEAVKVVTTAFNMCTKQFENAQNDLKPEQLQKLFGTK